MVQIGVDISEGDSFSEFAFEQIKRTWHCSPFVDVTGFGHHFRGLRGWRHKNIPDDCFETGKVDGSGTKPILQSEALSHEQAALDPIAMTGGDHTRKGGLPTIFFNLLDVSTLGEPGSETNELFRLALKGLADAAIEQQIVVLDGETAEMGVCVTSENPDAITKFIWAGFMVGVFREATMITGDAIQPGDSVVAIVEDGLRTNGYTAYRRYLASRWGKEFDGQWWRNPSASQHIQFGAIPPTLYDRFLTFMNGWYAKYRQPIVRAKGIAHITGGGIPGKFGKDLLFPRGLSAELNTLAEPSPYLRECVEWLEMPDFDAYKQFGCGQGLLAVLDEKDVDSFTFHGASYRLRIVPCGKIVRSSSEPRLAIKSRFTGSSIEYGPRDV
jgi:phosphoribosylformylglycinamidine cyclo-ligase